MNAIPMKFMPNWYMMFKSRDTDAKKLAFVTTILEYMFEGKVPECAEKDPSEFTSGVEFATYDAYWTSMPLIDAQLRSQECAAYGAKGGRPRGSGKNNPKKQTADEPKNQGVSRNENPGVSKTKNPPVLEGQNPSLSINTEVLNTEVGNKKSECESPARTREDEISDFDQPYATPKHEAPTWEEVKRHISNSLMTDKISEAFAREFYETAAMSEWRDTKGQDMRPSYVWKRKLQFQWNELLKEQRKVNGGMTDAEKLRAEERNLERENDALRRNNLADKQELEEMYESLDWLEKQKKKAEAAAKAKADAEAKAALADKSHPKTQEKAVA